MAAAVALSRQTTELGAGRATGQGTMPPGHGLLPLQASLGSHVSVHFLSRLPQFSWFLCFVSDIELKSGLSVLPLIAQHGWEKMPVDDGLGILGPRVSSALTTRLVSTDGKRGCVRVSVPRRLSRVRARQRWSSGSRPFRVARRKCSLTSVHADRWFAFWTQ